jgi:hypothetical protein
MQLGFAMIADVVSRTVEGKLNIVGEFNSIAAATVPARHPSLCLIARFHASVAEGSEGHVFETALVTEDGHEVIPRTAPIPLRFGVIGPGVPLRSQVMIQLQDLPLPEYGLYEFRIWVDGNHLGDVPLFLAPIPDGQG